MALGLHRAIAQKVLASVIIPHLKNASGRESFFCGGQGSGDFGT